MKIKIMKEEGKIAIISGSVIMNSNNNYDMKKVYM